MEKEVTVCTKTVGQILQEKINIPDYQRIYCWQDKNVFQLLDDIWTLEKSQIYHLGSIILQDDIINNKNVLNIIDGQQRLVTLSLIFQALNDDSSPLLSQEIKSSEAIEYIAYNKFLIKTYINRYKLSDEKKIQKVKLLKESLKLTVLTLKSSALDLAYTFFSNQNKQGVPLTNYDLLKSHHLRFIKDELWAKHLAQKWDVIIKESDEAKPYKISTTLGLYIFRLRNWIYWNTWDNSNRFKVKEEFEASKTVPEIPPFGEQFHFNEAIQGGTHFFAYTEHFINLCKKFQETKEYEWLQFLDKESHYWFREIMEALLFAYYLKFGTSYFSEALFCISRIISQTRFDLSRVDRGVVLFSPYNNRLICLIERATSPTFFLAECKSIYKKLPSFNESNAQPIQLRFYKLLMKVYSKIDKKSLTDSFKNEIFEEFNYE